MSSTSNSCIVSGQSCGSATDFPQFIDTEACLCGLLASREASRNGNRVEKWRCIGDANKDIESGGTGKWYNTSLPSEELSGRAQDQNWGDNPPDTDEAYVLEDNKGQRRYVKLDSNDSPQLIDNDGDCTGQNDTMLSGQYYRSGRNPSSSTSSSTTPSSTSSIMSSAASSSTSASSSPTGGSETSSSAPSGTSSSSSSSSTSDSSATPQVGVKAVILVGMLLAPMVAMMA